VALYRSAADVLKTDDKLELGGNLDVAGNAVLFGTSDDVELQYTSHASIATLNMFSSLGALTSSRQALRCEEGVGYFGRFQAAVGSTSALGSANSLGFFDFVITDADPNALKAEVRISVNTGDSVDVALTLNDDTTADFASSVNAVGGYEDNGTPGIDTTFTDNDGNTITVSGGIITAKTAP